MTSKWHTVSNVVWQTVPERRTGSSERSVANSPTMKCAARRAAAKTPTADVIRGESVIDKVLSYSVVFLSDDSFRKVHLCISSKIQGYQVKVTAPKCSIIRACAELLDPIWPDPIRGLYPWWVKKCRKSFKFVSCKKRNYTHYVI